MKRCSKCGQVKPLTEFYAAKGRRDGHRGDCKACHLADHARRHAANPEPARRRALKWKANNPDRYEENQRRFVESGQKRISSRKSHLKRTFGLTQADYDAMLDAQGGGCAICGRPPRKDISLHVDHDHWTGQIRALCCFPCNNAIGLLYEDPELATAVADYLIAHQVELARDRARSLLSTCG